MDKAKTAIIVIAVLFLCFVGYENYSIPEGYKVITPESFYGGNQAKVSISARDYYNKLHGFVYSEDISHRCKPTLKDYKDAVSISSNVVMFSSSKKKEDADKAGGWAELIGPEGEGCFKDGDKIINPMSHTIGESSFKNSNMLNSSMKQAYSGIDIEIYASDRVLIVFEGVKTWWCHEHEPNSAESHNTPVGNRSGSNYKKAEAGYNIGLAKESTRVKTFYISDDTYNSNLDESGNKKDISQYTDFNALTQIHTGKFLADGTIEKYEVPKP